MNKIKNRFNYYLSNILILCVAIPLVIIVYGFIISILASPILFVVWLFKQIF